MSFGGGSSSSSGGGQAVRPGTLPSTVGPNRGWGWGGPHDGQPAGYYQTPPDGYRGPNGVVARAPTSGRRPDAPGGIIDIGSLAAQAQIDAAGPIPHGSVPPARPNNTGGDPNVGAWPAWPGSVGYVPPQFMPGAPHGNNQPQSPALIDPSVPAGQNWGQPTWWPERNPNPWAYGQPRSAARRGLYT